jgi:uncharacterized membrane protein YheB (UPF0754 family)
MEQSINGIAHIVENIKKQDKKIKKLSKLKNEIISQVKEEIISQVKEEIISEIKEEIISEIKEEIISEIKEEIISEVQEDTCRIEEELSRRISRIDSEINGYVHGNCGLDDINERLDNHSRRIGAIEEHIDIEDD